MALLASWSQLPGVHSSGAVSPPAQYVPAMQSVQTRSCVVLGAVLSCWPGEQGVDQSVHTVTLISVLKVPVAQSRQTRSAVALGAELSYWPAAQSVQLVQGVAGSRSSSCVPDPQSTGSASPPAQYWPAVHSAQFGPAVPGSHAPAPPAPAVPALPASPAWPPAPPLPPVAPALPPVAPPVPWLSSVSEPQPPKMTPTVRIAMTIHRDLGARRVLFEKGEVG